MQKNVVITGASRGIGQVIAANLASSNHKLTLIASTENSFHEKQPDINYFSADFASFEAIDALADAMVTPLKHIDVLINNIGMYIGKSLADTDKYDIQRLMNVNFSGSAYFTHKMLPLLQKADHPQIINISSIAVKNPQPNMAVYTASKAAVTAFSSSLRAELNPQGIRVSVLHLSGVNTWNDPNPHLFLHSQDVARTIQFIIDAHANCQIDEITLSSVQ